uniref:Peptidase M13 N-terminal domain-containing protein n=1 Tax=Musca domestica TaxID=7370 RepID=A0A1I8MKE1_MUSDO
MAVRAELENPIAMQNKPKFAKKFLDLYKSCVASQPFAAKDYMDFLNQMEGINWLLLANNETEPTDYDWLQIFAMSSKYRMNDILVEEYMAANEKDPPHLAIHLRKYSREYGFKKIAPRDVIHLNKTMDSAKYPKNFYKDIRKFERKLIRIENLEYPAGSKETIELRNLPFEWLRKYLKYLLEPELTLDPQMHVIVSDVEYLKALDELLMTSDGRFLRRYMEMRFLNNLRKSGRHLGEEMHCVGVAGDHMPLAMHWIYEDIHPLDARTEDEIQQMFSKILQQVISTISHVHYLNVVDPATLQNLNKIRLMIGNLPRPNTTEILEEYYLDFTVQTEFHKNLLTLKQRHAKQMLQALSMPVPNTQSAGFNDILEKLHPMAVHEPIYFPSYNLMLLPSYLLRVPVYHSELEDIFKYSFLATTLASAVYSSLGFSGLDEEHREMLITMGGIHTAYALFFANNTEEEHLRFKGDLKELSLKKVFLINAMQLHCGDVAEFDFNEVFLYLPDFVRVFDCKFQKLMNIF